MNTDYHIKRASWDVSGNVTGIDFEKGWKSGHGNQRKERSFSELANYPKLERISFYGEDSSDNCMKILGKSKSLRSVIIKGHLPNISFLKSVKCAMIIGSSVKQNDIKNICKMPELTELQLVNSTIEFPGFCSELKNPLLKRVSIKKSKLPKGGLKGLEKIKLLEELSVDNLQSYIEGIENIKGLKIISFNHVKLKKEHINLLAKNNPMLEELTLANVNLTDEGLADLKSLKNLRWLELPGAKISDKSIPILKGFKKLGFLDLMGCPLSEKVERLICIAVSMISIDEYNKRGDEIFHGRGNKQSDSNRKTRKTKASLSVVIEMACSP